MPTSPKKTSNTLFFGRKYHFLNLRKFMYLTCIIIGCAFDQYTKFLAKTYLQGSDSIFVFKDILVLRYIENTWVAFGFPIVWIPLLVLTFALITILIWYFIKHFESWMTYERVGLALIICWALWNAYDRFVHQSVVDFISLKYFAIFNVADIVISVGAAFIILNLFISKSYAK
jgi:signal peptidase II